MPRKRATSKTSKTPKSPKSPKSSTKKSAKKSSKSKSPSSRSKVKKGKGILKSGKKIGGKKGRPSKVFKDDLEEIHGIDNHEPSNVHLSKESHMEKIRRKQNKIHATFDYIDVDGNGEIDISELMSAGHLLGLQHLDAQDFADMMEEADVDDNGTLDFEEFFDVMDKAHEENSAWSEMGAAARLVKFSDAALSDFHELTNESSDVNMKGELVPDFGRVLADIVNGVLNFAVVVFLLESNLVPVFLLIVYLLFLVLPCFLLSSRAQNHLGYALFGFKLVDSTTSENVSTASLIFRAVIFDNLLVTALLFVPNTLIVLCRQDSRNIVDLLFGHQVIGRLPVPDNTAQGMALKEKRKETVAKLQASEDPSRFEKVDEDGDMEEAPVSTKPKAWYKVWGGRAFEAFTALVMCGQMTTIHDPFLLILVVANVGLYIYQFFIQWKGQKNHWETNGINKKNAGVKSLFLSTFSHGDLLHLAGNMGGLIEAWNVVLLYDSDFTFHVALFIIYVVAGIGGTFAALKMTPKVTTMGASGAVYGIVAARTLIQGNPSGMMQWLVTDTLRTILERPGVSWSGHLGGGLAGGMVAIALLQ